MVLDQAPSSARARVYQFIQKLLHDLNPVSKTEFLYDENGKGQLSLFGRSFAFVSNSKLELEAKEGCFRAALCRGILSTIYEASPEARHRAPPAITRDLMKLYEDMSTLGPLPTRELPVTTPSGPKIMAAVAPKMSKSFSAKPVSAPTTSSSTASSTGGPQRPASTSKAESAKASGALNGRISNKTSPSTAAVPPAESRSDARMSVTPRSSPKPPSDGFSCDLDLDALDADLRTYILSDIDESEVTEELLWKTLAQKEAPPSALSRLKIFCYLHLSACRNPDTYKPFIHFDIVDSQQLVQLRIANSQAFVLTCSIDPKDDFIQTAGLPYIWEGLARQALAATACTKLGQKKAPRPSISSYFQRVARKFQDLETLGPNLKPSRPGKVTENVPVAATSASANSRQKQPVQPHALPRLHTSASHGAGPAGKPCATEAPRRQASATASASYAPFGSSKPLQRSPTSPIHELSSNVAPADANHSEIVSANASTISRHVSPMSVSSGSLQNDDSSKAGLPFSGRPSDLLFSSVETSVDSATSKTEGATDEALQARMMLLRQAIARNGGTKRSRAPDVAAEAVEKSSAASIQAEIAGKVSSPSCTSGDQSQWPSLRDEAAQSAAASALPSAKRPKRDSPSGSERVREAGREMEHNGDEKEKNEKSSIQEDSNESCAQPANGQKPLSKDVIEDHRSLEIYPRVGSLDLSRKPSTESRFSSMFQPAGPEIREKLSQLPNLIRNMQTMTEIVKQLAEGRLTYDVAREALYALRLPRIVDGPAFDALEAIWLNSPAHLLQQASLDDGDSEVVLVPKKWILQTMNLLDAANSGETKPRHSRS